MSLLSKIKNLITLCQTTVYQSGAWKVSLFGGETLSNIPHMQNFGLKGRAPVGAKGLLLSRGGDKSAGILIALEDDSEAPDLAEAEVSIYNAHGAVVHLLADGTITIAGQVTVDTDVLAGLVPISLVNHTHTSSTPGNPTGPPLP
jgi:phage gp45-like